MKFCISTMAYDYINQKGREIIIFKGNLSGCCGSTIPIPMIEVGHPYRPLENYQVHKDREMTIYLDNELLAYQGTAEIDLEKFLFWKHLSFNYREK
jgi:hypothetical protein